MSRTERLDRVLRWLERQQDGAFVVLLFVYSFTDHLFLTCAGMADWDTVCMCVCMRACERAGRVNHGVVSS